MNFPNEVSCSILIDPRDLGNVIGGKNSIDPRDLTVLPDGFLPLGYGFVADVMMEFASARRAAHEDGIDGPGWAERLDDGLSGLVKALRDRSGGVPGTPSTRTPSMPVRDPATKGSSAATSTGSRTQASSPRRTPGSTARRR